MSSLANWHNNIFFPAGPATASQITRRTEPTCDQAATLLPRVKPVKPVQSSKILVPRRLQQSGFQFHAPQLSLPPTEALGSSSHSFYLGIIQASYAFLLLLYFNLRASLGDGRCMSALSRRVTLSSSNLMLWMRSTSSNPPGSQTSWST